MIAPEFVRLRELGTGSVGRCILVPPLRKHALRHHLVKYINPFRSREQTSLDPLPPPTWYVINIDIQLRFGGLTAIMHPGWGIICVGNRTELPPIAMRHSTAMAQWGDLRLNTELSRTADEVATP